MIELSAPFAPDWVSPPGESILDMAEDRGWSQTELAQRLGYTEKHVSQLINGKVPLSVDAAHRLEQHDEQQHDERNHRALDGRAAAQLLEDGAAARRGTSWWCIRKKAGISRARPSRDRPIRSWATTRPWAGPTRSTGPT